MALNNDDKKWIKGAIVEGVVEALNEVMIPAMDNMAEDLRGEIRDLDDKLSTKIDSLDRKVMRITDNHSNKLDDCKKKIEKMERVVFA
jgi:hypothetical protein